MISSMTSGKFIEYLDTVSSDKVIINHPDIVGGRYNGIAVNANVIKAVPGLISPDEINAVTGLPDIVRSSSDTGASLWRYWSPPESGTYIFTRSHIFLLDRPCLDAKTLPSEAFVNLGIRAVRNSNPLSSN